MGRPHETPLVEVMQTERRGSSTSGDVEIVLIYHRGQVLDHKGFARGISRRCGHSQRLLFGIFVSPPFGVDWSRDNRVSLPIVAQFFPLGIPSATGCRPRVVQRLH